MTILKTKLLIAVVLSLIFVGCGKDDDAPTTNNTPFTFLKVGNEWVYEIYNRSDNELLGTTSWIIEKVFENSVYQILQKITDDSGIYHISGQMPDSNHWKVGGYLIDGSSYCWVTLHKNCYIEQVLDVNCGIAKIVSLSEKVTVPAGTFTNCIKIKVEYSEEQIDYYWVHKYFGNIMAEEKDKIYKLISKNF